jgi:ubiquinone/menaquinone biosynthesis C-methylase UbiE
MYVLYADNLAELQDRTQLFREHLEPLLKQLEAFYQAGLVPDTLPEVRDHLEFSRWPFRQLEYSFALDALLPHLPIGKYYLNAGHGITPLAAVFARRGVHAYSSDINQRVMDGLRDLKLERIYGARVTYNTEDMANLSYPDAMFDAISCISVLEHLPAPADQAALNELLRVLKPGGVLVFTVDFTPPTGKASHLEHYAQRIVDLARQGKFREIGRGLSRKIQAQQAISHGEAKQARSAHQCYEIDHLAEDLLPLLTGEELASGLPFSSDLYAVTPTHARRFWDLTPNLFDIQGRRIVLPAACIVRKGE